MSSEETKISVRGPAISSLASLRSLGWMPSGPVDLSVLMFPTKPYTSSLVIEIFSNGPTHLSETLPANMSLSFVNTDAKYSFRISPTSIGSKHNSPPLSLRGPILSLQPSCS